MLQANSEVQSSVLRDSHNLALDEAELGQQLYDCIAELFPLCRSITGNGVRETLALVSNISPLELHEVPSGTKVLDWEVPREWNIRDAWIKNSSGERVVDFHDSNLHVLNYSVAVNEWMSLEQLRDHLYTLPDQPDLIPYRTSYYQENWGFCLTQTQLDALPDGEYDICIDSSLEPGALTYGECYIEGDTDEEVLVSCHICHPSLANDNLSGVVIAAYLARYLQTQTLRYSYRFLFVPGTIGSIAWLAMNESKVAKIRHGLVLAGLGDSGHLSYKCSRTGDATIDQAASHVLQHQGEHQLLPFTPYGYDERQYCSPGFNLPVGRLSRTPHGTYPQYHTSADNLEFIQPQQLTGSLLTCLGIFDVIENDRTWINLKPRGEPQLSKYNLYDSIGGKTNSSEFQMAMLWVLNLCDGKHSTLDIADRSGLPFQQIAHATAVLAMQGLLKPAE